MEYLTLAESRVGPLEAGGEDLTDVGEVEEEQRDPDHGVEDGHDLPDGGDRHDVSVTCGNRSGCFESMLKSETETKNGHCTLLTSDLKLR